MTDDTPPTVLGRKTGTNTHEARLEIIKNWPVPVQSGCDCPRCTALERLAAPTAEFVCEVTHALSDEEAAMRLEDLTARKAEDLAAARRRAILSNQDSNLGHILLAVGASRTGSPRLLDNRELDTADKKTLTRLLHDKGGISQSEISKIVGVSRQMVHRYLKETLDG